MKGTALLINKDHSVTVLENVEHEVYEDLVSLEDSKNIQCTINDKEIHFDPFDKVVWYEETIDWEYGY
ncbi:hypothetical protein RGU12_07905 [Fredinandcohnia sp. QZ13]|uniref:hypothetical protein n=1 Tax=Fredinandcohnia sp. QZ13 TaxID=3073144 RepID=UPI0028530F92|nr:hypothetical protein [Fredinandcohnia sp. QZ13]MDR4887484.1 hypothetical protein [Fredinandcohnia sp. QZ13]